MAKRSEYPETLRRALGVRHTAVCELHSGQRRFNHPVLLWSDEPFDAAGVEQALRDLGWQEVSVPTPASPGSSWWRCDRFYGLRAGRFRAVAAKMRAAAALRADDPPARQPVDDRDEAARVAAEIPPVPVRLGESFPLLRFLVGYFRDRASYREHPGAYQVHCNRLALTLPGEGVLDLALHLGVAPTSVIREVVTPFLPVEADVRSDPGLADLDPPGGRNPRLGYEAFPVSPANMSIVGRSGAETTVPGRVDGLALVLTFPGDLEYIVGPEDHCAVYFLLGGARLFDREKGVAVGPAVALHVPESIDLIKLVRARLVRQPGAGRPRSAL